MMAAEAMDQYMLASICESLSLEDLYNAWRSDTALSKVAEGLLSKRWESLSQEERRKEVCHSGCLGYVKWQLGHDEDTKDTKDNLADYLVANGVEGGGAMKCEVGLKYGAKNVDAMLEASLRMGRKDLCDVALRFGGELRVDMCYNIARYGWLDYLMVLRKDGLLDVDSMLSGGKCGGHERVCRQALEWGAEAESD
jgi:hypothetical protein